MIYSIKFPLILLSTVFLFLSTSLQAQKSLSDFVTTWKTDHPGGINNTTIELKTGSGVSYNFDVDWDNDGVFDDLGVTGDIMHDYGVAGIYTIRIRGQFELSNFAADNSKKLISLDQWGTRTWNQIGGAFTNCSNLVNNAVDTPDLSLVTSLSEMFYGATLFNGDISGWDVSSVTNMSWMFYGASSFNQSLNNWDVSSVTWMDYMFDGASSFNQDLNNWDVSSVTTMAEMFRGATDFDGDITNWDVSSVTNMRNMFASTDFFNQNIDNWDVSSVVRMEFMFDFADSFNQDLNSWDVSSVTNMESMFYDTELFNGNISSWDVSSVTNMEFMFYLANSFNGDISNWDVSSVTNMRDMFNGTDNFNQAIGNWDVSSVTNMESMFRVNASFNQNLGKWDISSVTNMSNMLDGTQLSVENYDSTLMGWQANAHQSNVTVGANRLTYCIGANARISLIADGWSFNGDNIGSGCSTTNAKDSTQFVTTWKTDNVGFSNSSSVLIKTDPNETYNYNVDWDNDGTFDTLGVTGNITHDYGTAGTYTIRINGLFPKIDFGTESNGVDDAEKIISIDQWGTIAWSSMESAFKGCSNLVYAANDIPDLSLLTDLSGMFKDASSFNGDINSWDVSTITNMESMFEGAVVFNQNLRGWDVSAVTNMNSMFKGDSIYSRDLSAWDVASVTTMTNMLDQTNLSIPMYDRILIKWQSRPHQPNVTFGVNGLKYCLGDSTRSLLIADGWLFSSDALDCSGRGDFVFMIQVDAGDRFFVGLAFNSIGNIDVDWQDDGVFDEFGITTGVVYSYLESGIYTVRVRGVYPELGNFNGTSKLIAVVQWGSQPWEKLENFFANCENLVLMPLDAPDLTLISSLASMFATATSFNGEINHWNVSSVTNMSRMFAQAHSFNQPLNNWNVSSVTDMSGMFAEAQSFNQDISNWDVSSVTKFEGLFERNGSFNQPLNGWNVSSATNMVQMFSQATSFNQTLDSWDVSKVIDMNGMFNVAISFDQPLNSWDVSSVTNMNNMFSRANSFNSPLNLWDVSSVTNMEYMFYLANSFNGDISNWDVSSVTYMRGMFENADAFNQPLDGWDVSAVVSMINMFKNADAFNQPLENWDVSSVNDMWSMFSGASSFDQSLGDWDISSITDTMHLDGMDFMLDNSNLSVQNYDKTLMGWQSQAHNDSVDVGVRGLKYCLSDSVRTLLIADGWVFNGDSFDCNVSPSLVDSTHFVTTWNTNNPGFSNATSILLKTDSTVNYNYSVDWNNDGVFDEFGLSGNVTHDFGIAGVYTIRISGSFPKIDFGRESNGEDDSEKIISLDQWGTQSWSSMKNAFLGSTNLVYKAIDQPDLSNVSDMSRMFEFANAFNEDISGWDVSTVTNMSRMFYGASSFNQDIGTWNVSSVTDMSFMFAQATSFNQALNNWDVSSVTNMKGMFYQVGGFNQALGAWDVSSVTDMSEMFLQAANFNQSIGNWDVSAVTGMNRMFYFTNRFNQPLENWNVSSVTSMSGMFTRNQNFNQALNAWDVSSVTDMSEMFDGASQFNQALENWDVSNVTDMSRMFYGTTRFDQALRNWDISSVTDMGSMFDYSLLSVDNYDSLLIAWQANVHQMNVPFGAEGVIYCEAVDARNLLLADGWIVKGDSLNCAVGIREITYQPNAIRLYPNPTTGAVFVNVDELAANPTLSIYNSRGQLVKEVQLTSKASSLMLNEFENGLYLIQYDGQIKKVMLQR